VGRSVHENMSKTNCYMIAFVPVARLAVYFVNIVNRTITLCKLHIYLPAAVVHSKMKVKYESAR
jgi:hypothetical protein